jgi:hypothetical protein
MNRKYGANTDERNSDGTFTSANPGKPKGSRHKVTQAVEVLLEGQSEALTQAAIDKALEGDTTAMRLCLDRIAPARKDAPIQFGLPVASDASEVAVAAQAVLQAVSEGEVTPLEGATVMGLLERHRRTLEASEFEKRLEALETRKWAG